MRLTLRIISLIAVITMAIPATAATLVQKPNVDYFVVEAEDFDDELNDEFTGWLVIGPDNPQEVELHSSNPGTIMVPPPNANPSNGLAIFDQAGGGDFNSQISYSLNFSTAGEYFLYMRQSVYDLRDLVGDSYGNEDSIYLPVESIDEDPANDDLRSTRDGFVDLDNQGLPSEGCRDIEEPWIIPEDECQAEGLRADVSSEGQYHWQNANWNNGLGHANYAIDETGVALDFNVATRERGSSIDVFIFSQNPDLLPEDLDAILAANAGNPLDFDGDGSLGIGDIDALRNALGGNDVGFDVNGDGDVNAADLTFYVTDASILNSWIGDANLDGEFNSGDFVQVFTSGKYETGEAATWAEGDWNGDGLFNSGDFVTAFSDGGYEVGVKAASAVPEPSSMALIALGLLSLVGVQRRK